MGNKVMALLLAAAAGIGAGAVLGYGPLLRYKTEGVLSMEMGTSEYKRFTELANDASTVRQYIAVTPPLNLKTTELEQLAIDTTRGDWHKPVPKVSKADAKELPDMLLQMEQEKNDNKERKAPTLVYLGLRITNFSSNPLKAAEIAIWLGGYFKNVATREAVRDQVFRWAAESRQFSDRALERKLKYEFEIEQAQTRSTALKKVLASYPESARREAQQVVDVRKDNEKFMSPLAQLIGAESEIIEINEKLKKLDREIEQQTFVKALVVDAQGVISQARSGSESVVKLSSVVTDFSKKIKTEAEREKLLSIAADLSQISARFLSQAQFVANPSVPSRPERPTPYTVMAICGLLFTLLVSLYIWRKLIINLLRQEELLKLD